MSDRAYWRSLEERDADPATRARATQDEFLETPFSRPDLRVDRRGLLKGFAGVFAAVGLTGCTRGVVTHAIPLLVQPEAVVPGRATWYATTCGGCAAGCGMLVKCRDGRPIKVEGLPDHPISKGGLCAVGQAQVLALYDPARLRRPSLDGKDASWAALDETLRAALAPVKSVRVLTGTSASAAVNGGIARLLARFADGRHLVHGDGGAIAEAHALTHGRRVVPRYRFERARAIASFGADFLGTWLSPVEFTAGWRAARSLVGAAPRYSWLCQLEARLSLTGGNADRRARLLPGDEGAALAHLCRRLLAKAGVEHDLGELGPAPLATELLDDLAQRLWSAKGEALVVCGAEDRDAQTLVNLANHLLGAYGATVDLAAPSRQVGGADVLGDLRAEMEAGKVGALLVHGVNPAYELPGFAAAMKKVPVTVAFATHADETARASRFVAPVPHFLEAWGEAEPVAGVVALTQPAIAPLWDTRALVVSLARLAGDDRGERDLVRAAVAARSGKDDAFFDATAHDGFALLGAPEEAAPALDRTRVARAPARRAPPPGELALVLYPKLGVRDARHALNPWLQELPDPITKVVWESEASIGPETAAKLGLTDGAVVRLSAGASSIEVPVVIQPGQAEGTVALPTGYGGLGTERFATVGPQWLEAKPTTGPHGRVGASAAPLRGARSVKLEATGRRVALARTQDHHALRVPDALAMKGHEVRPHVRVLPLATFAKHREEAHEAPSLWGDDFAAEGPRWALAIDLNACTGCGACVVSCQAENNVPVVGKDEVRRHREMSWLRIDRYYSGEGDETEVVHQPMLCHHCGNAPCETVCPVVATVHSKDGLNQQVYNRCVGTRYCANNCPYKVRRFNWFDYPHEDEVERLVLNPDVTVRSRGVMEKCSLCHQRIQEARLEAKRRGVPLAEGDVQTACQQSCPARAIVFGDANDPASAVAARMQDARFYHVLPELDLKPGVGYLARVKDAPEGGHREG